MKVFEKISHIRSWYLYLVTEGLFPGISQKISGSVLRISLPYFSS